MVGNFVLRRHVSGAVKCNFRPYTSLNEYFEYGYPHSNALFYIYSSKAQHFAPNWSFVSNVKQLRQPITSDVTYDVGALTVYRRIYWRKFLTLSNQTSRYIRKCIRIRHIGWSVKRQNHWTMKYRSLWEHLLRSIIASQTFISLTHYPKVWPSSTKSSRY